MINLSVMMDERTLEAYRDLLDRDRSSLYYATPQYLQMLEHVTGGSPLLFSISDEEGRMLAALPAMQKAGPMGSVINSLPFYGSNPGIVVDPALHVDARRNYKKRLIDQYWNFSEVFFSATLIQRPFEPDADLYPSSFANFQDSRIGMFTPLPADPKELLGIYHQKTRNLTRKAGKTGIKVSRGTHTMVGAVKALHTRNMKEIGAPAKPESFFAWALRKAYEEDKDIRVYIAETERRRIVAGLITFIQNETVEYFTPAIDVEFRQQAPLNLVILEAMADSIRLGCKQWNWGGTTLPGQEGVYHFKKRFGAVECNYQYFTRISMKVLDGSVTKQQLLDAYPYFYIVPFARLPERKPARPDLSMLYGEEEL